MLKRISTIFMLACGLAVADPAYRVELDTQKPNAREQTVYLDRGATPTIRVELYDNGDAWTNQANWDGVFHVYTGRTATATTTFTNTSKASNYFDFKLPAVTLGENTYEGRFVFSDVDSDITWGRKVKVRVRGNLPL